MNEPTQRIKLKRPALKQKQRLTQSTRYCTLSRGLTNNLVITNQLESCEKNAKKGNHSIAWDEYGLKTRKLLGRKTRDNPQKSTENS